MQRTDPRKAAEAFIDKVIIPARTAPPNARQQAARAKLAAENRKIAHGELAAAGVDSKRLDKLAAQRAEAGVKLAEDARSQAVKASAAVANRLKGLLPDLPPVVPVQITLDTVTFIRSFANQGVVVESNIAPSENWARYRLDSTTDSWTGTGRLSFFTLWENQLPVPANMSAQANLSINAYLTCNGDWSGVAAWAGLSNVASAKVHVQTIVWGMDSSVSSIVAQQDVISAAVDGGFFGGDDNKSIAFAQQLPATAVVVPANSYVLLEVEVLTDWSANGDGASVSLDAESGSHRVDLPSLLLTVTPAQPLPPPITLMVTVGYNTSPATVTLNWSGATTSKVDVYRDGVFQSSIVNTGSRTTAANPGTYTFYICEAGSTTVCSNPVTITVTQ